MNCEVTLPGGWGHVPRGVTLPGGWGHVPLVVLVVVPSVNDIIHGSYRVIQQLEVELVLLHVHPFLREVDPVAFRTIGRRVPVFGEVGV